MKISELKNNTVELKNYLERVKNNQAGESMYMQLFAKQQIETLNQVLYILDMLHELTDEYSK